MKILRISLRNLASLAGTHTVDFNREPLRSTGLFAISGPTGSGKSTLLDALCLALYDDTPRLSAASGVQIPDTTKGNSITQKDPGNLLRRGAAEGFAEVAFVGVDGATYTSRWSIRRAHKNSDGALQKADMALLAGDVPLGTDGTILVGGKKTEVLQAIVAKVGLSFAQFTRAVLLAQNDFAVFLKSDDKERALILQALTGTERFERLSVAVFERNKIENEAVTILSNQLAGSAPLEPDPRAAAEVAVKSAVEKLAAAETACAERDRHLVWFQRQQELTEALGKASEAVDHANQALAAAGPRREELERTVAITNAARPLHESEQREIGQHASALEILKAATARHSETEQKTVSLRQEHQAAATLVTQAKQASDAAQPALMRARALDVQLEPLAKRLIETQREREDAEVAARNATERQQTLSAKMAVDATAARALAVQRETLAPFAFFADDVAAWTERLTAAHTARDTYNDCKKTFADKSTTAVDLGKKAGQQGEHVSRLKIALDQATAARTAAESAVKGFNPEALASQRRTLDTELHALGLLQAHWEKLAGISSRAQETQKQLTDVEAEIAKASQTLEGLQRTNIPSAQSALEASQSALALVEAAADHAVPKLRESLRPQTPCAVCGSEHHPYATHPPTLEAGALRVLREQVAEKIKALDALRAQATQCSTTLTLHTKQQAAFQAELTTLATQLSDEHKNVPASDTLASLHALPEGERVPALAERRAQLEQAARARDAKDAEYRQSTTLLESARLTYDQAQSAMTVAEQQRGELARERAAADTARDAASEQTAKAEQDAGKRLLALAPLFEKLTAARVEFDEDASAFIAHLGEQTGQLRDLDKRLTEATQHAANAETQLVGFKEAVTGAESLLVQRRNAEATVRTEHDALNNERKTLWSGRPVADIAAELERAQTDATQKYEIAALALADSEKALAGALEARSGQQQRVEEITARRAAAVAQLDAWLVDFSTQSGRALDRAGLAVYLVRDEAWLKAERTALEVLSAAVQTATGARSVNVKHLADHDALRPTTADETTVRADQTTRAQARDVARQSHLDAAAVITSDDRRRQDCAALLEQLNARRLQAEPWGRLNDLIGSADGTKFRAIVQRRTLDLLLGYANAQLDLLSARYRLERLPESLNLIVCDRDMADERRSVHSLSGGESFLVSLALALGLASLTSNRLRIESLFIDEGFGSLDPETLNTAMNALMHLESQGRKVGVISHVTEMADAIPVQIRVVKGRSGSSRLLVPGADPSFEDPAEPEQATPPSKEDTSPETIASLAATLLGILRREQAAGKPQVSVIILRRELGCGPKAFTAVREFAADQVTLSGKSLGLTPSD